MLTKRQLDAYNFLKGYYEQNRYMPSYQEIADGLGIKSKSGVNRIILALEERGALVRLPNRSRAIRLLKID